MYDNVLVLLDGSQTAEMILRFVPFLCCSAGTRRVTLLRVMEGTEEQNRQTADAYLQGKGEQLMQSWKGAGRSVPRITVSVVEGPLNETPTTIANYARSTGQDVVMLATRGWSGADWWSTASVAERIIKESTVPVFVVRPIGFRFRTQGLVKRMLVPLDGSKLAETAIEFAEGIAQKSDAAINLVHVQEQPRIQRGTSPGQPPVEEEDLTDYLTGLKASLSDSVLSIATTVKTRGSVSQQIADLAEKQSVDLIVMSSHGRTGPRGGEFGGVTDRVIHACHVPILVVPPRAAATGEPG